MSPAAKARQSRWPALRVPAQLKARLERKARHYDAMQLQGKSDVPSEFGDPKGKHVGTPLWYVIQRALDELDDKHKRSNRKRSKP